MPPSYNSNIGITRSPHTRQAHRQQASGRSYARAGSALAVNMPLLLCAAIATMLLLMEPRTSRDEEMLRHGELKSKHTLIHLRLSLTTMDFTTHRLF